MTELSKEGSEGHVGVKSERVHSEELPSSDVDYNLFGGGRLVFVFWVFISSRSFEYPNGHHSSSSPLKAGRYKSSSFFGLCQHRAVSKGQKHSVKRLGIPWRAKVSLSIPLEVTVRLVELQRWCETQPAADSPPDKSCSCDLSRRRIAHMAGRVQ